MWGRLEEVEKILYEGGVHVDCTNENGWTPLCNAASKGRKDVAALLIERGADLNKATESRYTPLSLAARDGHKDVAALLSERGADPNKGDDEGRTPLYWAAEYGRHLTARILEAGGAQGGPALCYAANKMEFKVCESILKEIPGDKLHNALLYRDKGHKNAIFRKTCLEWAVDNRDKNTITLILQKERMCHKDENNSEDLSYKYDNPCAIS